MTTIFDFKNNEKDISDNLNSCLENETNESLQEESFMLELQKYKNEISLLEEKNKNFEKSIAYLRADIENMRRQSAREIEVKTERLLTKCVLPFLSVFDDFERVFDHAKKINNVELMAGLDLTLQAFSKALQSNDIIEIKTDGIFNPEYHEAISTIHKSDATIDTIAQVVQKGFTFKKSVLRPAKVIIFA